MPEPKMLYYNADGKRVKDDDPTAVRQYLEDDPTRPDSDERKSGIVRLDSWVDEQPERYYVDADGVEVPEGDPRAVKQYMSDDPAAPKAKKAPTEDKKVEGPGEDKTETRAERKARERASRAAEASGSGEPDADETAEAGDGEAAEGEAPDEEA